MGESEQPAARILVIEDDESIQLGLKMSLEREGYEVGGAADGAVGLAKLRDRDWDLVILDIMLPQVNGYEVLGTMRTERISTPVMVLSARTVEDDKVTGLDLGAVDYVTKPFSVPELMARVRAALRRTAPTPQTRWSFGNVVVNLATREVHKSGNAVELTATEFNILSVLANAEGRALSRKQIFESVWGPDHHGTYRTIDNFVGQLRSKLEDNSSAPSFLLTVRGVGYRLSL
ncbi:MAG: response regulator transcription factor [Deltaproteobacteria bacterium]|nr:response regulator transcription factor [Deltaproteobacteria bacterium]